MGIKKNQLAAVTSVSGLPVTLDEQLAAPGPSGNKVKIYSKDVAGLAELFVIDDAGNEVQITSDGAVNGGGGGGSTWVVGVQNTNFSATAGHIYVWDTTATLTAVLPAAPADNTQVAFYGNAGGTAGALTLDAGTNVLFAAGGPNTLAIPGATLYGIFALQFRETSGPGVGFWGVISADLLLFALSQFDYTILATGSGGALSPISVSDESVVGRTGGNSASSISISDESVLGRTGAGSISSLSISTNSVLGRTSGNITSIPISSISGSMGFSSVIFTNSAVAAAEPNKINRWAGPCTLSMPVGPSDGDEIAFLCVSDGPPSFGTITLNTGDFFFLNGGPTSITLKRAYAAPYGPMHLFKFSSTVNAWLLLQDNTTYMLASAPNQMMITDTGATLAGNLVQPITVGTKTLVGRGASGNISALAFEDLFMGWSSNVLSGSGVFPGTIGRTQQYNPTGGGLTIQFPAGPAHGDRIAIKEVANSSDPVTISAVGADVENDAGALVSSFSIGAFRTYRIWMYRSTATAGWYRVS